MEQGDNQKDPLDRKAVEAGKTTENLIRPIQQAQMSDETRAAMEENEKLLELGQENEKEGARAIKENTKQEETKAEERRNRKEEKLRNARSTKPSYRHALLTEWHDVLIRFGDDLPSGFSWFLKETEAGVELWVKTPTNSHWVRGLKVSGDAEADIACMYHIIDMALGYVEDIIRKAKKQSGILTA